jgi:tetratricopeptide (TPR) repeat protein
VTCQVGRVFLHEGPVEAARSNLRRTLELFEEVGDQAELAWACCYMGDLALLTGDWTAARQQYERSADRARTRVPRFYCHALLHLAELSLLEGRTDEGLDEVRRGSAAAEECSEVAAIRKAQRLLAEQDLLAGDPAATLDRLRPLLAGLPTPTPHDFPPPALAEAYLGVHELGKAETLVAERLSRFREQNRPRSLAGWLRVEGMMRAQQQRWDDARVSYEDAARVARTLAYPYPEARALFELGLLESWRDRPTEARACLERALAIFEWLGARPQAERAKQALETSADDIA